MRQILIYCSLLVLTAIITTYAYFYFREEWVAFYAAENYANKKEYHEAVDKYYEAMNLGLYTRRLVFRLGDALVAEKRFEEAIPLYKKYLQIYPDDTTAQHRLFLVLSYANKFNESIKEGEKIIEKSKQKTP